MLLIFNCFKSKPVACHGVGGEVCAAFLKQGTLSEAITWTA